MRSRFLAVISLLFVPLSASALEVDTVDLSRDVTAWYAADDTLPIVHIILSFEGAGYASDPADKRGLAQLASSALLEGAGSYDALAFQEALESHAIGMDTSLSADRLIVSIHTLKEHAPLAGKLALLALTNPRLDDADIVRLKAAQKSALQRASESAAYRAARQFAERAFANHPYTNPPLGDAQGMDAVSAEDIRHFINTYLTSGNLKIAVSGDVTKGDIHDMLAGLTEALPRNDTGAVDVAMTAVRVQGAFSDDSLNVPQTSVLFGAPGIRRDDPEFYAAYVLMQIVGGDGLTSRLAREIRQAKGLVYSATAGLDELRGAVLVNGSLSTRNETRDEAIAQVKEVFGNVYVNGVSTQECKDAKTYVQGHFPLQLDNTSNVASMLLSMQIYNLGQDYIEKRQEYFDAVSCSDINRAAKTLLDPSRFLFVSVGGQPKQDTTP
jgi:zinc protease